MSLTARIGEKKIFRSVHHIERKNVFSGGRNESAGSRRTSCLESRNQTFLGSGGRNDSNSHQLARIGEKKIFH